MTDLELMRQPAKHWEAVALDLARDISEKLNLENTQAHSSQAVYVTAEESSSFALSFEALLVEELRNAGINVVDEPAGAYRMRWALSSLDYEQGNKYQVPFAGSYVGAKSLGSGAYRLCADSERLARALRLGQSPGGRKLTHVYRIERGLNELLISIKMQNTAQEFQNYYYIKYLDNFDLLGALNVPADKTMIRASEKIPVSGLISFDDLTDTIFFQFDEYRVTDEYLDILDKYVDILTHHPDIIMVIEGHTDTLGPEEYNMYLSGVRAESVRDYLLEKGVSPDQLQTRAHSHFIPAASHLQENVEERAIRAMNRRVELYLIIN